MFSLKNLFINTTQESLKPLYKTVIEINALEEKFSSLSSEELRAKTQEFKERTKKGETLDAILPETFAAVREAAKRTLGERHFDVQLIGGIVMHKGGIAEMKTGEGKTLVATLPVYLNALSEKGVHIVTVNDYLSRRDAVWMGQVYGALGMSVGVINHESSFLYDANHSEKDEIRDTLGAFKVVYEFLRPCTRKEAYMADITYGTNSEFGFDYLRDNLEIDEKRMRQREFHYAIIDEIDSILIDEARTPLIISAPVSESEKLYERFTSIASQLKQEEDYTIDEKHKSAILTDAGISRAEKLLGVENIYTERGMKYVHHLELAIRAKALFHCDKEYVVRDGAVVIVDEFTGRLQPGRRWSEGLHQAIEAKEGAQIQQESRTFASITYQNYFRTYTKLSGMTGTALTSSEEFYKVYGLTTTAIPTNVPVARKDQDDLIFQTENGKFKAVAKIVHELHSKSQPVLIGTASIEKNELLSEYLSQEGIPHEVLNAKNNEREGEIIAQAGKKGMVTIATNMAGRGVDIKLGGNPATKEQYEEVKNIGGLFVIGTERHEAQRIDNQLRGRSGRQGDFGETQFFVSLEDTLMRVFASDMIKGMMGRFGIPEDEPIQNKLITRSLEAAQRKIEGFNFDARKHILEFDNVLNHQRQTVYSRRRKILTGGKGALLEYLKSLFDVVSPEEKKVIEEKIEKVKENDNFASMLRVLILQAVDTFWVDHLETMEYLRGSVNLRAYGQRDPLVEYKKEGLRMFKEMEFSVKGEIVRLLPNIKEGGTVTASAQIKEMEKQAAAITGAGKPTVSVAPVKKIGRNDPCPCGAKKPDGTLKKYKHCHGKNS
ncbi:MAG: preprotein translocase subunit SecA [Candidatus Pacebacteria bacterium]|nr:preprotein translocase subunit SecA [Candidatus Paceibacterota bacterium]